MSKSENILSVSGRIVKESLRRIGRNAESAGLFRERLVWDSVQEPPTHNLCRPITKRVPNFFVCSEKNENIFSPLCLLGTSLCVALIRTTCKTPSLSLPLSCTL